MNGVVTNFVYDALSPVQGENAATVTANLLTGLGIDEFFTRTDGAGVRALLPDVLGSTVAFSDSTGTLQTQYAYDPFGVTTQTGSASTNSYKYTGREDDGTGSYYYRARYYVSSLSRFLSEDPTFSPLYNANKCRGNFTPRVSRYVEADPELSRLIAFRYYGVAAALAINVQKLHLYVYAEDNPINKTDPSGLISSPPSPGCDVVGGYGGFFDSPCAKKCCDAHDRCFDEATDFCDASTWIANYPPRPQCDACNTAVLGCLAEALKGYLSGRKGCS